MANEFRCSKCGRDGTRCDCFRNGESRPREQTNEERSKELEREIKNNIFRLKMIRERRTKNVR